jgi:hypothetical protein
MITITTVTLQSPLIKSLFPVTNAPIYYRAGISNGKLNGLIIETGP